MRAPIQILYTENSTTTIPFNHHDASPSPSDHLGLPRLQRGHPPPRRCPRLPQRNGRGRRPRHCVYPGDEARHGKLLTSTLNERLSISNITGTILQQTRIPWRLHLVHGRAGTEHALAGHRHLPHHRVSTIHISLML